MRELSVFPSRVSFYTERDFFPVARVRESLFPFYTQCHDMERDESSSKERERKRKTIKNQSATNTIQYFLPKPEKDVTGYLQREILLGKDNLFWPEPERDIFDHIERLILHRVVEKSLGFENLLAIPLKTKTEEMVWQAI